MILFKEFIPPFTTPIGKEEHWDKVITLTENESKWQGRHIFLKQEFGFWTIETHKIHYSLMVDRKPGES